MRLGEFSRRTVLIGFLIIFFFTYSLTVAKPEFQKYQFLLNGTEATFDCLVEKEAILVPLYEVAPLLGCTVEKCEDCKMDTLYLDKAHKRGPEDKILFKWESDLMAIGQFKSGVSRLDAKTVRWEGKTYLSLQAFGRIGFRVEREKMVFKIWREEESGKGD